MYVVPYAHGVTICFYINRLEFAEVKYVAAFKEYELELKVDDSAALIASIEKRLSSAATYSDYVQPIPVNVATS